MFNIIKYEFIRKYKLISIVLITSVLVNIFAIFKNSEVGSMAFLGVFPIVMAILYIIDIIKMYSEDLNNKSGYMLFMTPNSGYKIIISKMLAAMLEGIFILLLYFVLIILNGIYVMAISGAVIDIKDILYAINSLLDGSIGINLGHIFVVLLTGFSLSISFVLTAYTAITIRKSIFSEIKFGGLLSFIIFIGLNWIMSYTSNKLMSVMPSYQNITINIPGAITASELLITLMPVIILSIIESILLTVGSGYLLEKKINL